MTWPLLRLRQVPKQYLEALIVIIGVWLSRAASLILSRWGLSFGRDFMGQILTADTCRGSKRSRSAKSYELVRSIHVAAGEAELMGRSLEQAYGVCVRTSESMSAPRILVPRNPLWSAHPRARRPAHTGACHE